MASLKKELKECTKHGSNVFPMASYFCRGKKFNINIGMHWHPEVEINRFESGDFIYNYAMKEYKIKAPCIALIPGNVLHNLQISKGANQSSVVFNPSIIELNSYDEVQSQLFSYLSQGGSRMPPFITTDMECFAHADKLLSFIIENSNSEDSAVRLRVKAHLLELLPVL